jgi:hypothetical protein
LLLAAIVLAVGIGILFLARQFGGSDIHKGGPLAPAPDYRDAVATPVDLNARYSWGLIFLHNNSDKPAHLEALDLGQVPTGLHILGSYAATELRPAIGFGKGYRPDRGHPVEGLVIPPHGVYEVIVGLSATAQGRHIIPEARVRYESGGQKYEATFKQSVVLCAPKNRYQECPSPLG